MTPWTPRGADPTKHHTLVDGIPQYMYVPVREWFLGQFRAFSSGGWRLNAERMQRYDLAARLHYSMAESLNQSGGEVLFDALGNDERLQVIDWTVFDNDEDGHGFSLDNDNLERILLAGSSAWRVGSRDGYAGLERRVPEGVQVAAEAAIATTGDAGRFLSEAWHAAFGLSPQPDLAYRKSIEAVEAAVLPLVIPNDSSGHLGKAIHQMRADANWTLPFVKEHAQNRTGAVVINMMQALWSGHSDRHPGTPTHVKSTQEAAEAAVMLAVPIVAWFSSGAAARR